MQIIYLLISVLVIVADQSLKHVVVMNYSLGETHTIIPGVISFNYLRNDGAAWNIFSGQMWLFYLIALVAIIAIFYFLFVHPKKSRLFNIGLCLTLGGIIGNLIDRIHLKYVIDMIQLDFVNFNIFNLADSAITLGILCIFIYLIFIDKDEKNREGSRLK